MKYKLVVRAFSESDISRECAFPPDSDDLDIHLSTLADNIKALSQVDAVTQDQLVFVINLNEPMTQKQLKHLLEPCFSGDIFCEVRFVSLDAVNEKLSS